MSANFTFMLGVLDLSSYLRVAPGEGLDPYSPSFVEPAFSETPFADGAPLTSVDVKNREMHFPVHFKAVSKDALHALLGQVGRECAKATDGTPGGLTVEWRDAGASASTFYDVRYARFEPDFNYRKGEHQWASGVVHIWVGYGHTGTTRIVGTLLATGAGAVLAVPSVGGDVPALLDARVKVGTSQPGAAGRLVGVAALPHPSYRMVYGASDMIPQGRATALILATNAAATAAISGGYASSVDRLLLPLSIPSVYAGENRLLLTMRQWFRQGVCLRAFGPDGEPLGPTAVATSPRELAPVDLGVLRLPTGYSAPTAVVSIVVGRSSVPGNEEMDLQRPGNAWEANQALVVPEARSAVVVDTDRARPLARDDFNQPGSGAITNFTDELGNPYATDASLLGPVPVLYDSPYRGYVNATGAAAAGWSLAQSQHPMTPDLRVKARITTLGAGAGNGSNVFAVRHCSPSRGLSALMSMDASPYLAFQADDGTKLGSVALAVQSFNTPDGWELEFTKLAGRGWATLRRSNPSGVNGGYYASLAVASHVELSLPGRLGFGGYIASWNAQDLMNKRFEAVSADALAAPTLMALADEYRFDGVGGAAARVSAGSQACSMDAQRRGAIPPLAPSTPLVGAFSMPLGYGAPVSDTLAVDIRVRERFTVAR